MPPKPWKLTASHPDKSYRVFSLRTDHAVSPRTGQEHEFFVVECPSWVNVIPLTPENKVVMVRQYRHGTRSITLEIPGGLVEDMDTPEETAIKELREETGYKASEMISLGSVHPNPAIQNNQCYTFLAKHVCLAGEQQQDEKEDIEVLLHPLSDIPRLIKEGEVTHSLVLAAFYRFYMEYDAGHLG